MHLRYSVLLLLGSAAGGLGRQDADQTCPLTGPGLEPAGLMEQSICAVTTNVVPSSSSSSSSPLHPILQEFQDLIESDPRLYMFFDSMFDEDAVEPANSTQYPAGYDYHRMLHDLNYVLHTAPSFNTSMIHSINRGSPFYALLRWAADTPDGHAALLDKSVNAMIGAILNVWGDFLTSPASAHVLDDSPTGWFHPDSLRALEETGNLGQTAYTFSDMYTCDATAPAYGFPSWDAFFTRTFRPGIRPVSSPDDDSIIVNACESRPYALRHDVAAYDRFWIKGLRYSMRHMLAHDALADSFVGGTVYQAFLSSMSYHRWHAPVAGRIVRAYVVNGTYFSHPLFDSPNMYDTMSRGSTQAYLAATATRALIFIEADNPAIGLMVFIGIGMVEVSTCEITVREGQYVAKGDQLGMFHFGGSSHVLAFRPGVNVTGFPEERDKGAPNVPVRGRLAVVNNREIDR
ncbi:hypothetical protein FE257_003542 [Aspergillus nanangensis]|uniref:L-tryptophan decarboxylase PsiD-like domain-containing protein n=1 Tax=Aspergillus nanangensis TaxID=2582783 RepID=A0AAD4GNG0_ASPNN|nr:hypothetical protein FE257_003542 [Aspergillus nanangensis]